MPRASPTAQRTNFIPITPWDGVDRYHSDEPEHASYQLSTESRPALLDARNILTDNSGNIFRRKGLNSALDLAYGQSSFSGAGLLLVHDRDRILSIDPDTDASTVVASGLSPSFRVVFAEKAGQVWWSNGEKRGVISGAGVNGAWGMAQCPAATVSAVSGSLAAGRYQVVCTSVGPALGESGCGHATEVELTSSAALHVDLSSDPDPESTHVRIYATARNMPRQALMFQQQVAISDLPVTLTGVRATKIPLQTQFFGPPPAADGIFDYIGYLLLWSGSGTYISHGISHHLFNYLESESLPYDVRAAVGVDGGFWRVTAKGAWWTTGTHSEEFRTEQRSGLAYAAGSLKVPGTLIPKLQTARDVGLFVSTEGLMAGMPDGVMIPLTRDRENVVVDGMRATIVLLEDRWTRNLVYFLTPE